jgi:hypothetical protein
VRENAAGKTTPAAKLAVLSAAAGVCRAAGRRECDIKRLL